MGRAQCWYLLCCCSTCTQQTEDLAGISRKTPLPRQAAVPRHVYVPWDSVPHASRGSLEHPPCCPVQAVGEAPRRSKAAASPTRSAAGGQSRGWDDTPYTPPPPRLLKRKGVGHVAWVPPGGWQLTGGGDHAEQPVWVTSGYPCQHSAVGDRYRRPAAMSLFLSQQTDEQHDLHSRLHENAPLHLITHFCVCGCSVGRACSRSRALALSSCCYQLRAGQAQARRLQAAGACQQQQWRQHQRRSGVACGACGEAVAAAAPQVTPALPASTFARWREPHAGGVGTTGGGQEVRSGPLQHLTLVPLCGSCYNILLPHNAMLTALGGMLGVRGSGCCMCSSSQRLQTHA